MIKNSLMKRRVLIASIIILFTIVDIFLFLNKQFIFAGILAIVCNILLLFKFKIDSRYFDVFGVMIWIYLICFGIWLLTPDQKHIWGIYLIIIFSLMGLITDSCLIIKNLFLGGKK